MFTLPRIRGTWDFIPEAGFTSWQSIHITQFVKLAEGASVDALRQKLAGFADEYAHESIQGTMDIVLNPLTTAYLSDPSSGMGSKDQGRYRIYLLSALSALVLLIAAINFTNLATAHSLDHTREVSVRKTLGAQRRQLARHFSSKPCS